MTPEREKEIRDYWREIVQLDEGYSRASKNIMELLSEIDRLRLSEQIDGRTLAQQSALISELRRTLAQQSALISELRERLAVAVEALEWYSDKNNWVLKLIKTSSGARTEKLQDRGKRAKKALSTIKG